MSLYTYILFFFDRHIGIYCSHFMVGPGLLRYIRSFLAHHLLILLDTQKFVCSSFLLYILGLIGLSKAFNEFFLSK